MIESVSAITRTYKGFSFDGMSLEIIKGSHKGYDKNLSRDMPDWYSPKDSSRFSKQQINFVGRNGNNPVVGMVLIFFNDVFPNFSRSYGTR